MKNHKQQLRVGNLLHHISFGDCKVLGIYDNGSIHICDVKDNSKQHIVLEKFINRLEEIPISEKRLLTLGFNKDYKKGFIGIDYKAGQMTTDFVLTEPKYMGEWQDYYVFDIGNNKFVPLKFIHQLQNLFTPITEQDLQMSDSEA